MTYYIQPVRRCGFIQWRAFGVRNGTTVWECMRWSERDARAAAMRQAAKVNN